MLLTVQFSPNEKSLDRTKPNVKERKDQKKSEKIFNTKYIIKLVFKAIIKAHKTSDVE